MLDTLAFALTAEGAALCGRVLLELLQRFEGRQLATYGVTGVPLMQAAIAQGRGRYHGLLVRKERKAQGARRLVEGRIDPKQPVVLIDDTVSSGGSLEAAAAALAEERLFVEGAAVLVRFNWLAGAARLVSQGWHLEAAIDLERELAPAVDGRAPPLANPFLPTGPIGWSEHQAPDGLKPTALARLLLEELASSGRLLRPPRRLDRDHDARGGVTVSLRSTLEPIDRPLRTGFWRLPGDEGAGAPHEIALACWQASQLWSSAEQGRALLASAKLGLTLFGALRATALGAVDPRRHGIVLRSGIRPEAQAGALPNLPGVTSARRQLDHALGAAQLTPGEPFELFRHAVTKHVEEGIAWPVGGAPDALDGWTRRELGPELTRRARAWVLAARVGRKPAGSAVRQKLPAGVDYLFLTIFADGVVGACVGAQPEGALEAVLEQLTARALADGRSEGLARAGRVAVEVTALYARRDTGWLGFEDAARYFRLGFDAVGAVQGDKSAIVLPAVASHLDLGRGGFLQALLDKAGISEPPCALQVWRTAGWLDDGETVWTLDGTFPRPAPGPVEGPAALSERLERLLADYLIRNVQPDGRLPTEYDPIHDRLIDGDDLERQSFVAWILAQRARTDRSAEAASRALTQRLETELPLLVARGLSGSAMLLCVRCEQGAPRERLEPLVQALGAHPLDGGLDTGHLLVALAKAQAAGVPSDPDRVEAGLRMLRHRFRHHPALREAVLPWAVLAHAAWAPFAESAARTRFVREAIDVAHALQGEDGGFQTSTQDDAPGCTTAPMLEALGAAIRLAPTERDLRAHARAARFLETLIYQERDCGLLPNPGFAEGGLRYSAARSPVRIDFVAHALHGLMLGRRR